MMEKDENVFKHGKGGFTMLAHRVTKKLIEIKPPPFQRAIWDFVMMETWGQGHNFAPIALDKISEGIGKEKRNVAQGIKALVKKGLLTIRSSGGKGGRRHATVYQLNLFEDSETLSNSGGFNPSKKGVRPNTLLQTERVLNGIPKGCESEVIKGVNPEPIDKEANNRRKKKEIKPDCLTLSSFLLTQIKTNLPKFKGFDLEEGTRVIEAMISEDGRI
jgi:hypothetical protein